MDSVLVSLAEIWRWRWKVGFPVLLGMAWGVSQVIGNAPLFEARTLLQLQSEQAREPLLQKITARGHEAALYQKLTHPEVLADSGQEAGVEIKPGQVKLTIFNDHFLGVSYKSEKREGIEQVTDSLAFNFIQQVLAPERARVEQMLQDAKQDLVDITLEINRLEGARFPVGTGETPGASEAAPVAATGPAEVTAGTLAELRLRKQQLERDIVGLQTDLRLVNTAFDRDGSQALLWFAQPAVMVPPAPFGVRLTGMILWGGLVGFIGAWLVFVLPSRRKKGVENARDVQLACGMPVVGTLPWLGRVRIGHGGAVVKAGGRVLRPSEFGEIARLQAALVKNLRGPLVLVGPEGNEGTSLAALLLAEKTASLGKTVILVDLNLKTRGLTKALELRGEGWTMPKGKKGAAWSGLQPLTGIEKLKVLPAPDDGETLAELGEPGGLGRLMDALSDMADVVIVDTSPVAATNRNNIDAVAVAGAAKKVALVAVAGVNQPAEVRAAADALLLSGAALAGVVLNLQYVPSRRQLLSELADFLGPLGGRLRRATVGARLD